MKTPEPTVPPPLPYSFDVAGILRWLREDRWFAASALLSVMMFIACLFWTLFIPLHSVPTEIDTIVTFFPIPGFMLVWLVLGKMADASTDYVRKRMRWTLVALCGVTFIPNFYLSLDRKSYRDKLIWSCDGKVTEKYVSQNHAMDAIVVTGKDVVRMEGITKSFYDTVNVGDSVVKEPWSEYAMLNGTLTRILPPSRW